MKCFVFLLLITFTNSNIHLNAGNIMARIFTTTGNEHVYQVEIPYMKKSKLTCYDESHKRFQMDADSISHIMVWSEDFGPSKSYTLAYSSYIKYNYKNDKKNIERKIWMLVEFTTDRMICYSMADQYKINKQGLMVAKSEGAGGFRAEIWHLLQKKTDEYPVLIAFYRGGNNKSSDAYFRNYAGKYFVDCPELVQKIENRELDSSRLKAVMTFYEKNCLW